MHGLTRRSALRTLGLTALSVPLIKLVASCSKPRRSAWASGGTAAMTDVASYPDPFAMDAAGACPAQCETTEGPCTTGTSPARRDISDGMPGLPVRLALQVVAAGTCAPLAGALVTIWHAQRSGVYSGVTPSGGMCRGDDAEAEKKVYFRGTQTTDAQGRVDFDTCYPGWYRGRAVHIHAQVTVGGALVATTQLFFADALTAAIYDDHADYRERGQPDVTLARDNVIGGEADRSPYVVDAARMPDGAMLASKRLAVATAADATRCEAKGAPGGPGGPGGFPFGPPPGGPGGPHHGHHHHGPPPPSDGSSA